MTAAPAAPLPDGWRRIYFFAIDRNGAKVHAGTRVRVLSLSSQRLDALSAAERHQALAMVGEVFDVENTDLWRSRKLTQVRSLELTHRSPFRLQELRDGPEDRCKLSLTSSVSSTKNARGTLIGKVGISESVGKADEGPRKSLSTKTFLFRGWGQVW